MRSAVLLVGVELRDGHAGVREEEIGVIAEAALAARGGDDLAVPCAFGDDRLRIVGWFDGEPFLAHALQRHGRDDLFDPFVTTKREGRGLGLALVAKLARDMGGTVQHVRDGEWTRFRVNLPAAQPSARKEPRP